MPMNRWCFIDALAVAVAFSLWFCVACSTITVSDQSRTATRYSQYRTYDWSPSQDVGELDVKERMMREAIRGALDDRRIERALAGSSPDFLIQYHVRLKEQPSFDGNGMDYPETGDQSDPYTRMFRPGNSEFYFDEAHFEIRFLDFRTRQTLWRGEGTEVLDQNALTPFQVNRAVKRILENYPGR